MQTLFSGQTDENLFSGQPLTQVTVPPTQPKDVGKVSMIAALARTDPGKPDIIGQLEQMTEDTRQMVERYGDVAIREELASRRIEQDYRNVVDVLSEKETHTDFELTQGLIAQGQIALDQDREKLKSYILEKEAAERIQELAAAGDPDQARMLLNNFQYGDTNRIIADSQAKTMMIDAEIRKFQGRTEGDWIGSAINFVLSALPLYGPTAGAGNVEIDDALKGWSDWLMSGRRRQIESNTMYNLPIDQFKERLSEISERVYERSNFLGFQDNIKALDTLSKLQRPKTQFEENSWDLVTNLGFLGPAEIARAGSLPGLLIRGGARKESAELLARTAQEIKMGGSSRTTIEAEELIDNMLPDAVNPATKGPVYTPELTDDDVLAVLGDDVIPEALGGTKPRPALQLGGTQGISSTVSVQADVNDIFTRTQALMGKFQELNQAGRLTTQEMEAAVAATLTRIKKIHGEDWVKDIKVHDVQLSDGTKFKKVEFSLGTFTTPDEAMKYARDVGLGDDVKLEGFPSNADRAVRVLVGVPTAKQPLFAKWFGKSKVVNPDGTPRTMYHGTYNAQKLHEGFDPNHQGGYAFSDKYGRNAIFFAEDPQTIKKFNAGHASSPSGDTGSFPVYIKSENPFDPKNNAAHRNALKDFLQKNPITGIDPQNISDYELTYWGTLEDSKVVNWITDQGFDSAYIYSNSEGRNLMVWDPEQIISAIDPKDLASQIVRDESGVYSLRVAKDVDETGFFTAWTDPKAKGLISRYLFNARQVGSRLLANKAQTGGDTKQKILMTLADEFSKKFAVLSKGERESLAQVLAAGDNSEQWFNLDQLEAMYEKGFRRPPSVKEIEAYQAARDLNDIEYVLRNDEMYKRLATSGFEEVSWEGFVGNGKVLHDWSVLPTDRVFNLSTKTHHSKSNPMTGVGNDGLTFLERYKQEGYVLVQLDEAHKLPDGTTVNAVFAKKGDIAVKPLRREQLGYRAGGHRFYEGKYFLKQARIGVQPDGEKFLQNPGTFAVGTKAEMDFLVARLEQARILFKNQASREAIERALPPSITVDDFLTKMEDGTFNQDISFRSAFDRETLPEYVNTEGFADLRNADETDIEGYLRTAGRMYYGHKGEALPDFMGNMAPTLNPFDSINRSLYNVAQLSSFGDYKIEAANRWHKNFGGYLTNPGMSPMQALREGQFVGNLPEPIRQAAEAQRDVIKRTLGWRTEFDRQVEIYTRRGAEWVMGQNPYSLRHKVGASVSNWWDNANPLQAMRGFAFDLKMGMLNVGQFPMQLGTMLAATTMSPRHGIQGMSSIPFLKLYNSKSGTENMLDAFVQRGVHDLMGFEDVGEFKAYMRYAKKSGRLDVGGTHSLIGEYGPNAAIGSFTKWDGISQKMRFFFNEAEQWNRIVAQRIAWGETRKNFPDLALDSPEFLSEVTGRAEEFAFGMSEQSAAAWQKGILSIPTQFWSYNARMIGAMLGDTFTPAQKARLIIFQSLLYGSAGIPLAGLVTDMMAKEKGAAANMNNVGGIATRGLIDSALYHLTGQDVLVSQRMGVGNFWPDLVKDLFNLGAYGEKSFAELVGGASANITWQGLQTIGEVIKYAAAESGDQTMPLTKDAIVRLSKNVATLSNLHKAYLIHNYGVLISNKGTVQAAGIPDKAAFAQLLGILPGEVDEVSAYMGYMKDKSRTVEEHAIVIKNLRSRWIHEVDRRSEIEAEINMYVRLLGDDVKYPALERVGNSMDSSMLDSLVEQVMKDKMEAEALQNLEND